MDASAPITVSLITFTDDIYSIGPRRISAQLKRHGIQVNLIFLRPTDLWGQLRQRVNSRYYNDDLQESVYQQLIPLLKDSAVIGLSVWTHQAAQAALVTERLRRDLDALIVWGGIHPTSYPEEVVRTAGAICIGEGDVSFLNLVEAVRDGRDYRQTRGFWFLDGDEIIRNPGEPLVEDLDELPFLDFEFEHHLINDQGTMRTMDLPLMKRYYGGKLWTMFSHGCPYKCTFCSNDVLIDLDRGYRRFRKHSVSFYLAQLTYILSKYPHIQNLVIDDDAYMFLPLNTILEFARKYREEFDMPFFVSGVIPASVDERKFQALIDAGMVKARIGIQSGNERIMKEVFVRPMHDHKLAAGSEIAYKNRKKIAPIQYDLIVDNPWENPAELKDTLRLVASLKPPYTFAINSLTLLPGTRIYNMGETAGFTNPQTEITLASYVQYQPTMLNLTLAFYNLTAVPQFWLKRMLAADFGDRTITMKQYPRLGAVIIWAGMLKKVIHSVARRDVSPIPRPLDLILGRFFARSKGRRDGKLKVPREYESALPRPMAVKSNPRHREAVAGALPILQ